MELAELLVREHGVARAKYLIGRGATMAEIRTCLRSGALRQLRRGWYATSYAEPTVESAVRSGGVLGCVSALQVHGIWVPPQVRIHVRGRHHPCRQYGPREPEVRSVDDVSLALRHAIRCLDDEGIVVVCDSLIHLRVMSEADIGRVLTGAPGRVHRLIDRCDRAESGTESMVRLRLRRLGIVVETQVVIPGIGRVDLLVGRLIIEVDGVRYHVDPERFENDRRRDRRAVQLGYTVIRLSYRQVLYDWAEVERDILEVVRRRDHRWPRRERYRRRSGERGQGQ